MSEPLLSFLADVPDPRIERKRLHPLPTILGIALCAVICGADSFVGMEEYGQSKYDWLASWLPLPNGIPSHDTFARVFARLEPQAFGQCLQTLARSLLSGTETHIAIDGKYLRHSFDTASEQSAWVMLSAWASEQRLVLGSVAVDLKSNEITAIPTLLKALELEGCVVTIDAMGCQTAIAGEIVEAGGQYVLSLKGNQASIHQDVQAFFAHAVEKQWEDRPHQFAQTQDWEHGRTEIRRCWQVNLSDLHGTWDDAATTWHGLKSLVRLESERTVRGVTTTEVRYYLSSLAGDVRRALRAIRQHWGIENSVHWVLDVAFDEDDCRIRKDHAPVNMATLRQMALNLLRQETTCKKGIAVKRGKAGWDNAYLRKVIDKASQF